MTASRLGRVPASMCRVSGSARSLATMAATSSLNALGLFLLGVWFIRLVSLCWPCGQGKILPDGNEI